MKKFLQQEKGSIFIITLNVIIILTVFLFSFSFISLMRLRAVTQEARRFQANLNAKSGMVLAAKEFKESKLKIPFKKQYRLFDDEHDSAEVSYDKVVLNKKGKELQIVPAETGGMIRIISVGKYQDIEWKITVLMQGDMQMFYYGQ